MNSAKKRGLPKLLRMVLALFAILVTVIAISYIMCLCCIKTTQYDIALEGIENPVRLVVVADTHGKVFDKDNMPLYKKIRAQEPDVIVLLGDLLPSEFEKADKADAKYSPLYGDFKDFPPTLIMVGKNEILYEDMELAADTALLIPEKHLYLR